MAKMKKIGTTFMERWEKTLEAATMGIGACIQINQPIENLLYFFLKKPKGMFKKKVIVDMKIIA
ncbi:MAG: hypothetical protein N3C60_01925 [Calditerrivibrio sp.]|nr:hypothetical protein [Calditerrivibrio sp.]